MYPGSELISNWLEWLEAVGRRPQTVRSYRYALQAWGRWCWCRSRSVEEATGMDGISWVASMRKAAASEAYVLSRMAAVTSFYEWARGEDRTKADPLAKIPRPKLSRPVARDLDLDHLGRILAVPWTRTPEGIRDRAILQLLWESALRRGEAAALRLQDIDIPGSRVFVACGKGGRARWVFVGPDCITWLARWLEIRESLRLDTDMVWISLRSLRPMRPDAITRMVRMHGERAGSGSRTYPSGKRICQATPHALRHTCATQMIMSGADLRTAQEHLGHASVATTERYVSTSLSRSREAVLRLPRMA
jgi:integrase/recombinase XerD